MSKNRNVEPNYNRRRAATAAVALTGVTLTGIGINSAVDQATSHRRVFVESPQVTDQASRAALANTLNANGVNVNDPVAQIEQPRDSHPAIAGYVAEDREGLIGDALDRVLGDPSVIPVETRPDDVDLTISASHQDK